MTYPRSRRPRRHLLVGGASAALAATLAGAPAQASDVQVSGPHSLVSEQTNIDVSTRASAVDPIVKAVAPSTEGSSLVLSGNTTAATARGNQAANSLAPDALDLASGFGSTWLTAGADTVEAQSGAVIANVQTNDSSPVHAGAIAAKLLVDGGYVADSQLSVDTNTQEAIALGNDVADSLTLTGGAINAGAGIVNYQAADYDSPVSARLRARASLVADDVSGSDLALTDNLQRAIGYGNSADNTMTVDAVSLSAPTSYGLASQIPSESFFQPEVLTAFGILNHQVVDAEVGATAGSSRGPTFGFKVGGDLSESTAQNDGNTLIAAGYGNQASNGLELGAVSVERSSWGEGGGEGAVAGIANAQRIGGADVRASSRGGALSEIQGSVADSWLSASDNTVHTIATGNRADGNLLVVRANGIEAPGVDDYWGGGEVGSALLDDDENLTASAPFSVQNAQDFGSGQITATQKNSHVGIFADGDVARSALTADDNIGLAAATGNSAVSGLTLEATSLQSSADVNSFQTGSGQVLTTLGRVHDRAGATIRVGDDTNDASLSVSSNTLTGTAIGNSAANSLAATADIVLNGSGHDYASAGSQFDGHGARADFALANAQRLGAGFGSEGGSSAEVASSVTGRFAIGGEGETDHSSLVVDDNAQAANALGNTAVNRIAVTATNLISDYLPAAGSALSSLQSGDVDVQADSDLRIVGNGGVTASSVSLSGNSNRALAVINDVDNALSVDAVQIGALTGYGVGADYDPWGGGALEGDHVLANIQEALGDVEAAASTRIGNDDSGAVLDRSRSNAVDNTTSAEASANRGLNSVAVTAASEGNTNAGLLNSQYSRAGAYASASSQVRFDGVDVEASSIAISGNATTALARGNVADNRLALVGSSRNSFPFEAEAVIDDSGQAYAFGSAVLLNGQTNDGAVSARAVHASNSAVLNGFGADAGRVGMAGNSVAADAYGNAATNRVGVSSLDRLPTAAVVNAQANYGPVTAQVVGASYRTLSGPMTASSIGVSGNQVSATATGNQATNIIASLR